MTGGGPRNGTPGRDAGANVAWQERVEALFEGALDCPEPGRAAWLAERCGDDEALMREVRAMLAAHDRAGGILDSPVVQRPESPAGVRGRRIGAYRLLKELGRGGMGVVYLAERDDGQFRRRVAIKLLRASPDAEEMHRRFLAERQILASLDHPNIAQLLDGGVTDGQLPYLVMEYVDGVPITTYCDRRKLDVATRVRLFRDVCAAVQHAHRNLVIHRDLKPGNILVTEDGTVKLLDFGIAKLLNPMLGGDVPETHTAFRVMTPEYASPEQVRGATLSTTSDVYSLGVVLYELLAGHRPYRFTSRSPQEVASLVCERDPERPSSRAMRTEKGVDPHGEATDVTPEKLAELRDTSTDRLRRDLAGDVDAIVMMALRKEPARRYGSAESLAEDLTRYLERRPVLAQRPTAWYRLRKLVTRHRIQAAAVALAALSLAGGAGVASWQATIAARERDRTRDALRESQEIAGFLLSLFEANDPRLSAGSEITARDLLRRGAQRVEELSGEPLLQARMLGVLARVYERLGDYDAAQRFSARALAQLAAEHGEYHADVAAAVVQLAGVERRRGEYTAAQSLLDRALAIDERLHGAGSAEAAATLDQLAGLAQQRGDFARAEERARQALDARRAALGDGDSATITSLVRLGSVLRERGDHAGAEAALREALRHRESARAMAPAEMATDLVALASLLASDTLRRTEAEAVYRRALVIQRESAKPDHEVTLSALDGLARLLEVRGDPRGAEEALREVVDLRQRFYGDEHPTTSAARLHLAGFLRRTGRLEPAEALYRAAIEIDRKVLGPTHPNVTGTMTALGVTLTERGRLQEADALLSEALRLRTARLGPNHFLVARTLERMAEVEIKRGQYARADSLLQRALAIVLREATTQASAVREIHGALATLYEAWGRRQEAARFRLLATADSTPDAGRVPPPRP